LPTAKLLFLRESPKQNQTKDDKNRAQQQTAEWRAHRNLLFLLRVVLQNSMLGINKSLLARYIYGISKPSEQRLEQIREALHDFGRELQSA
jgi:hypothetical protein